MSDKLKVTVKAQRSMFNKLTGRYVAKMLGVEQTAETKEKAVEQLEAMLDNMMRYAFARRYLIADCGTVFMLHHVPGGWAYDIVRTDKPGAYCPGSCMMGEGYNEAYEAMKRHWADFNADHAARMAKEQAAA